MASCFLRLLLRNLVCLPLLLSLVSASVAQEEESIFSRDEALISVGFADGKQSPAYPATAYWQITATMTLTAPTPGTHVQMLLPLSDGRQSVLARRTNGDGVSYREEADGLNLWGHWWVTVRSEKQRQISYAYVVQISDLRSDLPVAPFPLTMIPPEAKRYLLASALIQSDAPRIQKRARELIRGSKHLAHVIQALYDSIAALPSTEPNGNQSDALAVLRAGRGDRAGKTRALVALLRAAGVPARVVGGIQLGDTTRKRTTISWAEALVGDSWVPLDPAGGHFAWLPNTYLALYRNDLPLVIHTRQVPVEYTFLIHQTTRNAAFVAGELGEPNQGKKKPELRYQNEHVHTVAIYVDRPVASVVLINEGTLPQGVVEQIQTAAQEAQVNIALLSADFESSYFREHYLQSLVSNNLTLLREANILVINTADTAGLYALIKQGELGVYLTDLRVVIAGKIVQPVGKVLAALVLRLVEPAEIILLQEQTDLLRLWEIARSCIRDNLPLVEGTKRWHAPAVLVNAETVRTMSWWRRWLIDVWSLAVRALVPLPALNLILVLPLIAFFLLIIRNVIGLETFGTFSPMLLALAFLTTGLGWGLLIFLVVVGLGTGLRLALQRLRLHLVSRVAILIAMVAVSMAGLTVLGAQLGIGALLHVSIFPMVITANVIENFTNTQLERGTGEALRLTLSTLLVATCSYIGIENTGLKPLVLTFPELLIGVIGIELLLGRWRGLRLVEYLRFYAMVRQEERQEEAVSGQHTTLRSRRDAPAGRLYRADS